MIHLIKLSAICLGIGLYSGAAFADSFGGGGGAVTQGAGWTVQPSNTPNTTPWLVSINQGGSSVAVKAASTTAALTDPSMVVALSPNTPPINNADAVPTTATLTAVGTASVATNGASSVTVSATLTGTTPSATLTIQGQMPDLSWQTVNIYPIPGAIGSVITTQPITLSGSTLTGEWLAPISGFSHVRLNLTAITGTTPSLAVNFEASQAAPTPSVDAIVTGVSNIAVPVAMQTCQQYSYFDGTAAAGGNALTPAVSATSGHIIHICSYSVGTGATATNVGFSTNASACAASGDAKLTPYWQLTANGGRVENNAFWQGLATASTGVTLCVESSAANPVQAEVFFSVY